MYASFAGDPVVQSMSEAEQRRYVMLLCLKCDGLLDRPIRKDVKERLIAKAMGLSDETFHETFQLFHSLNLVDKDWQPSAWSKRQYTSDVSTSRVRRYRKSLKQKEKGNVSETLHETDGNSCRNGPDTEQIQIRTEGDKEGSHRSPACPFKEIVARYNQAAEAIDLPRCSSLTESRKRAIRARWNSSLVERDMDRMENFFQRVEAQPFLAGKNSRQWRANIDWLFKESNFQKVAEMQYEPE